MMFIVWNQDKTIGIITHDKQLAYELRKGSLNTLGIVDYKFMDAWGDMTVDDNCTIEEGSLMPPGWKMEVKPA